MLVTNLADVSSEVADKMNSRGWVDMDTPARGERHELTLNTFLFLFCVCVYMNTCVPLLLCIRSFASQGSEENTVVYVVGKAGRQHWQHVYTAVTRGRSRVYIIAEESELRSAIRKRSFPRQTRLKHFLQKKLSDSCAPSPGFPSQPSSPRVGGRQGTPPSASPLCRTPDNKATANSASGEGSSATKERFSFDEGWLSTSFNDMDTEEESAQLRRSKRTGDGFPFDEESPSKFRMVEESSPQVSSIFQNLRLNKLIPRQLFKPTDNQETAKSGVMDHTNDPSNPEMETGS